MAITKILTLKDCGCGYSGKHLKRSIDYIVADAKTGLGHYVAGVNCQPDYAYEQMYATKQKFGKTDKRQGYHLIISFAEEEVDPETAFEIIGKFVERYLGTEYEAVYAVHDNTAHVHGHIIFNSVNCFTGKKYRYEKGDWAKSMQPLTNQLCEEYGLSTITIESGRRDANEHYKDWNDFRDGKFVYTVEDTGNLNHYGNDFDIFYATHAACGSWGRRHVKAYLAEGNTNKVEVTVTGNMVHNLTYKDYMAKGTLDDDQTAWLESMMGPEIWKEYYKNGAGQAVAELALTKVGCKYDQDRRMEEGIYDCSSLVLRLYREVGIELPNVASTQGEYCFKNAMIINQEELQPGDLIFYSTEQNGEFRNITHVAIYVGDGKMVHAAGKARGVVLDPLKTTSVVFYARPYN